MPIAHGVEFKIIDENYATPLLENISKYLTKEEKGYFIPLPYNYTTRTNSRQLQAFQATDAKLGNEILRKLKHTVGSDVTWSFILAKNGGECFYTNFVRDVTNCIQEALFKYPNAKIVCLGHSQGTQLFYSFLFDYPSMVDLFITMGSPISMNSGAFPDWGKIPTSLNALINFWHDKDFISSRLQGCHPSPAIANFVQDYKTPNGWNPLFHLPNVIPIWGRGLTWVAAGLLAHVCYWKSDFVARTIAGRIKNLIKGS